MPQQRILLADDSSVTRDLLKLLLTERGHHVDLAEDGEAAQAALAANPYDLVLMDFHLPKLDGLQVTAAHRGRGSAEKGPRFIAITADVEGLLAHAGGCETFDGVIPKPFDIERICAVIEERLGLWAEEEAAPPPSVAAPSAPPPQPAARSRAYWETTFRFLRWPEEFDPKRIGADFDGILIEAPVAPDAADLLWQTRGLHLLPVIDLTGALKSRADLDASRFAAGDEERLAQLIAGFIARRRRVHQDMLLTEDPGRRLLGRLFVAKTGLMPAYDPSVPAFFSYNALADGLAAAREAEILCDEGHLRRSFFDRFRICAECGSARHSVREKCVKCGGTELDDAPYLHHFRCAYQGPEADFRRGRDLVCPKCTRLLNHLGEDYDRPGAMVTCAACRHSAAQSQVKFLCMDCGLHMDTESLPVRDVYAYELTDKGISAVEFGPAIFGGRKSDPLQLVELPLELIIGMNGALSDYKASGKPFCVLDLSYRSTDAAPDGAGRLAAAREALIARLGAVLKARATIIKGRTRDFILMKASAPDEARRMLPSIKELAMTQLPSSINVELTVYGPEDFS